MTTNMNTFEMRITEIFTLGDNTTVFVGSITSTESDIGACSCELVSNGRIVASFQADGEMILKNKTSSERAISTTHPLNRAALDAQSGKLVLRGTHPTRSSSQ